ncbi:MAG: exo-alpha-sialidase [Azoarcus sp.]|nr:exo-alpha-sialidase [Azoarcus sp.]
MKRYGGALLIAAVTLWAAWPGLFPRAAPDFAPPAPPRPVAEAPPRLSSALINAPEPPRVHAASLTELPGGGLLAVWFGGSREGSADVRIYGAEGTPDEDGSTHWRAQEIIVSPARAAGRFRWVRKLGNPVVFATPGGETWMIHVSATLGGWAASRLNLLRSPDKKTLSRTRSRQLTTSPFFNMSTLVKGPPVFFDNGDIGVPVYHEMAGKFAELLVLSPAGEVRRKIRMDHGRRTLQPVLLVEDARHAVALMRDARGDPPRVWRSETADAGRHWSAPEATDLPNPNSALGAVRLEDGRLLAVANDTEDERLRLSLLVSEDRGRRWRVIHRFEDKQARLGKTSTEADFRLQLAADIAALGPARPAAERIAASVVRNACRHGNACAWQYDYPYLIRAATGDFHLLYTWNRSFIRHIRFNTAWLRARLEAAQ